MTEHRSKAGKTRARADAALRAFNKATGGMPPVRDPDECEACDGYGHIRPDGTGTVDRRERTCGNCRGTGKKP